VIAAINAEWIKLRTVRMNLVLTSIGLAFPTLICVLTAVLSDGLRNERDVLGFTTGAAILTALIIGVLGAVSITGEFTHLTIRPTFAAIPRRWRVLVAKGVVLALGAAIVSGLVVFGNFFVTRAITDRRDLLVGQPSTVVMAALAGTVAFSVLVALFGYGLGMMVRNQPTAIALLLLWPLLVEGLVAGLLAVAGIDNAFRWLPYGAGLQLASPEEVASPDAFSRLGGGVYFAVFVALIAGIGAFITSHRDA
jgi:ABC-2 type transport system permease protein